ncbi:MAG TPA: class I SAM-dependent methyltransferase [Nitrospiraceae bacterium]|nr:class I SAM-dependent methyltransferase [Nitrospiraceae bacterium]
MTKQPCLWDSGERVPTESHNTLYLELLSAYETARKLLLNGIVLDIGCSAGYGANHLAGEGQLVLGIDDELAVVQSAAHHHQRRGLAFVCMDGMHLGVRSASVDLACAFQVLEHVSDSDRFLAELARILRPSGLAILSTPNALTHKGPRNPFHVHEFMPEELKRLLGRHFTFVSLAGQRRPAEVYLLEQACQQIRRWDVLGLKRLLPRKLISLVVYAIARFNRLTPPQRLSLHSFPLSSETDKAYSLFALCGHAPLPQPGFQTVCDS